MCNNTQIHWCGWFMQLLLSNPSSVQTNKKKLFVLLSERTTTVRCYWTKRSEYKSGCCYGFAINIHRSNLHTMYTARLTCMLILVDSNNDHSSLGWTFSDFIFLLYSPCEKRNIHCIVYSQWMAHSFASPSSQCEHILNNSPPMHTAMKRGKNFSLFLCRLKCCFFVTCMKLF